MDAPTAQRDTPERSTLPEQGEAGASAEALPNYLCPENFRSFVQCALEAFFPSMMEVNHLTPSQVPPYACACLRECTSMPTEIFVLGSGESPGYDAGAVTPEDVFAKGTVVCELCLFSPWVALGASKWVKDPTVSGANDFESMKMRAMITSKFLSPTWFFPARTMRIHIRERPPPPPQAKLDVPTAPVHIFKVDPDEHALPCLLYSDDDDDDETVGYESDSDATVGPDSGSSTVDPVDLGLSCIDASGPGGSEGYGMPLLGHTPLVPSPKKRRADSGEKGKSGVKRSKNMGGDPFAHDDIEDFTDDDDAFFAQIDALAAGNRGTVLVEDTPPPDPRSTLAADDRGTVLVKETPPPALRLTQTPPGGWISTRG
jgi:hypothetical protein